MTVASSTLLRAILRQALAWSGKAEEILQRLESSTRSDVLLGTVLGVLDEAKQPLADSLRSEVIALKILNLLLCRHHMLNRSDSVLSRPIGLILDPINTSQMSCPGCVHSQTSVNTATALFHRYGPFAVQAAFCNYGEPTLNPDTPRMIRIAKEYRLRTTMSSNLAHPRFRPEEWIDCGLDFLIVSIDAIQPETYSMFRRNGNHELAFENLRALIEAKRRHRLHTPVIHWQFLAFEHNKHEIAAAIDVARDIGVNQLSIARPFDVTWDDPSIRAAEDVEPALHRFDLLTERWLADNERAFPLNEERIHEAFEAGFGLDAPAARTGATNHTCSWLYKKLSVDANGRLFPCCCAPRADADLMFGTLEGAEDPFNSPKHKRARQYFAGLTNGDEGPYCTRCDWPQDTAQIDRSEIRRYLRGVGAFSASTIESVSSF